MQEVESRSGGAVSLHTGTLYRALARLLEQDLIEEIDARAGDGDGRIVETNTPSVSGETPPLLAGSSHWRVQRLRHCRRA